MSNHVIGNPTDQSQSLHLHHPSPLPTIPEEHETDETQSVESTHPVTDVPETHPTETTTHPQASTLSKADSASMVHTFSFGGDVSSLNLPTLTEARPAQVVSFFQAHQDETPTAISLSSNHAVFQYGGESIKVKLSDLAHLLKQGEVAGESRLAQSLIVAQTVGSMGLSEPQSRHITRSFVRDLQQGVDPSMARVNAYSNTAAALSLGTNPKAQLEKDMATVESFFKNAQSPKVTAMMGKTPDATVKNQLFDLMAKRMNAIANNNFALAFDLQESARHLAEKNGMPPIGAPGRELPEPSTQILDAAESHQSAEQGLTSKLLTMLPGESENWALIGEGGVKVGASVGFKAPIGGDQAPTLASASVAGSGRVMGKSEGSISRETTGDYVVTIRTHVAGGVKGEGQATAGMELGGGYGGADVGRLTIQKLRFATARDAAKFLAARQLEHPEDHLTHIPKPTSGTTSTDRPTPGHYVVVEESSGLATHTETQARHLGVTREKDKASLVGQSGFYSAIRRMIPGLVTRYVNTDTTRYANKAGESVVERSYSHLSKGGNMAVSIFSLGLASRVRTYSQIDLSIKQTTRPIFASDIQAPTAQTAFTPSLSIQINADKVKACKNLESVDIIVEKEFKRTMDLARSANKDCGRNVLDLSDDGQTYLKESIRKAALLIYNEANRTTHMSSERRMVTNSDQMATDVGLTVSKTGISGGVTTGGMVTFKVPFREQKDGTFAADVGNVEVGLNRTSAARFMVGIGVDSHDIPGSPVGISVSVYAKGSATDGGYTQLIGNATVKEQPKRT